MNKEQFYDVSFEMLPAGSIRLEQCDSSGESCIIDLHPVQITHMARVLMGAEITPEAKRITTLERRLRTLQARILECRAVLPVDFYDQGSEAFEFDAWLQASMDLATELCSDLTQGSETNNKTMEVTSL
jgi:hypothetical protein